MSTVMAEPHTCTVTTCWGWGSIRVEGVEVGWKCPGCGWKASKTDHTACVRPGGQRLCGGCAKQVHLEESA